jgi:hypothetical protein
MGSGLEALKRRHQEFYSDMSFDLFLRKRHQKYYSDMPYEYYLRSLEGPARPGFDPVKVEGTGGEPMEPTEAMMGVVPTEGVEELYPEIGATVGGMTLGIPGAAFGGAVGELGREFVAGEDISPKKIVTEGGIQGGIEAVARGGTKVAGKILAPSAKNILPETKEAAEYFRGFGGEFSPAQAVEGKLIDLAEGVSEASMTGGPRFFKFREGQARAFKETAAELVDRIGTKMGDYEIGLVFADAVQKSDKVFRTQAGAFYKNVDSLTKGASVDITALQKFAEEKMGLAVARKGIGGSAAGDMLLKRVSSLGKKVVDGEIVSSPFITFEEAAAIRSGFIDEVASFEGKRDKASGLAKRFLSLTHEAMEESAKNLGDEAFAAWEKARAFY